MNPIATQHAWTYVEEEGEGGGGRAMPHCQFSEMMSTRDLHRTVHSYRLVSMATITPARAVLAIAANLNNRVGAAPVCRLTSAELATWWSDQLNICIQHWPAFHSFQTASIRIRSWSQRIGSTRPDPNASKWRPSITYPFKPTVASVFQPLAYYSFLSIDSCLWNYIY